VSAEGQDLTTSMTINSGSPDKGRKSDATTHEGGMGRCGWL